MPSITYPLRPYEEHREPATLLFKKALLGSTSLLEFMQRANFLDTDFYVQHGHPVILVRNLFEREKKPVRYRLVTLDCFSAFSAALSQWDSTPCTLKWPGCDGTKELGFRAEWIAASKFTHEVHMGEIVRGFSKAINIGEISDEIETAWTGESESPTQRFTKFQIRLGQIAAKELVKLKSVYNYGTILSNYKSSFRPKVVSAESIEKQSQRSL